MLLCCLFSFSMSFLKVIKYSINILLCQNIIIKAYVLFLVWRRFIRHSYVLDLLHHNLLFTILLFFSSLHLIWYFLLKFKALKCPRCRYFVDNPLVLITQTIIIERKTELGFINSPLGLFFGNSPSLLIVRKWISIIYRPVFWLIEPS